MQSGLYKADFRTPIGEGAGVISIEDSDARGGDSSFWYSGTWSSDAGTAKATLAIRRHSDLTPAVFGPTDSFTLELSGEDNETNAVLHGSSPQVPGVEIHIRLNQLQRY